MLHLPFTCLIPSLIQLAQLEHAEERLDGRRAVRIRSCVHEWNLHLPEVLARLLAHVISGIVKEDYTVFLPTW